MTPFRALAVLLAAGLLSAQQLIPCGPYVVSDTPETELTAAAFGAASIDDLCLAPDPNTPGGYFGFVVLPGTGAQAFRWTPGSAPVVTTNPGVPSAGQVLSINIGPTPDANGKLTVLSVRPSFFPGFFVLYMSKVTPDATATDSDTVQVLGGGAAPAVAPNLGDLNGTETLIWVTGQNLFLSDTDSDASSPSYGSSSNLRTELLGFAFANHCAAIRGPNGESRSLLITRDGAAVFSQTAAIVYQDVVEAAAMPTVGSTQSPAVETNNTSGAFAWLAQIDPSTLVFQSNVTGTRRLQLVSTSSTAAPIGQTSHFDVRMPSDRPADMEFCFVAMTLAGTAPAGPVAGPILGNFCLSQTALFVQGQMIGNTGVASFQITPPGPFWAGIVLSIQGFGFEAGSPNGYFGNSASVEIVN